MVINKQSTNDALKKNDEFYIKKINDMMMRSTKPTFKSLYIIDNEKSRKFNVQKRNHN